MIIDSHGANKQKFHLTLTGRGRGGRKHLTWKVRQIKRKMKMRIRLSLNLPHDPVSCLSSSHSRTEFITFLNGNDTSLSGTRLLIRGKAKEKEKKLTCGIGGSKAKNSGQDVIISDQR